MQFIVTDCHFLVGRLNLLGKKKIKKTFQFSSDKRTIFATETFVFPFTDTPLTASSSSPLCKVPSFAAGVPSNTYTKGTKCYNMAYDIDE